MPTIREIIDDMLAYLAEQFDAGEVVCSVCEGTGRKPAFPPEPGCIPDCPTCNGTGGTINDLSISGADLVDAFTEWRAQLKAALLEQDQTAARVRKGMAEDLENRLALVLSTGHLRRETCDWLEMRETSKWPVAGGELEHGFYIYAHDEDPNGEIACWAPEMWACLSFARKRGFDYVQFDADGPEVPDLETFDHEADAQANIDDDEDEGEV